MSLSSHASLDSLATLQVDFMTTQMCEMQHEVDDKQKTETALKAAEQARKQVRQKAWAKQQISRQMPVLCCACMQVLCAQCHADDQLHAMQYSHVLLQKWIHTRTWMYMYCGLF